MKQYLFFILLAFFHVVILISLILRENNFLLIFDKFLLTFIFLRAILNLHDANWKDKTN